jgi:hypothetical protein
MSLQPSVFEFDREAGGRAVADCHRGESLYRGVKSLLRCDEAEAISGIARFVVSQRGVLQALAALIERRRGGRFPALVALVGGLKCFLAAQPPGRRENRPGGVVWIARLGNERRAIDPYTMRFPEFGWSESKFRLRPSASAISTLVRNFRRDLRRMFRLARLLHRRYEFYQALRVIELVAYYARYLAIFRAGRFALAVTSNHSNPHGIAFNLAARKCGVPVALITHGMPVRPVARLTYDLAVVHCEAARETYQEEGCHFDRLFVHGRRQDFVPMPAGRRTETAAERLTVGVFLCKDVNEGRLRALVEGLLGNARVARVLVRPHPTNLWTELDAWIDSRKDARLQRSRGGSVFRDVEASDVVLAGNSSVLVEAVTAGRTSGFVPGLDCGAPDMHEFVARGLIYQVGEDLGHALNEMPYFYRCPDWPQALRLFANIDEDEAAVATRAGGAMRQFIGRHQDGGGRDGAGRLSASYRSRRP